MNSTLVRIKSSVKSSVRSAFGLAGLEVRRKAVPAPIEPPPLYDDPLEALYLVTQHGQPAAFRCPIAAIVDLHGYSFKPGAWHPFVATTRELALHGEAAAEAMLDRFYSVFRPRAAAGAYPGFCEVPEAFASLPPHFFHFSPWDSYSAEEFGRKMTLWIDRANREHGRRDLTMASDGHPTIGPVTPEKRKLEIRRLAKVRASLEQSGFDRSKGDCRYLIIRRGRDFRCIPHGGGLHRTAVMAALGAEWMPAQLSPARAFVDVADVEYWPQVRRGVWSRRQALGYVDYLFDYNAWDWARQHAAALGIAEPGEKRRDPD